MFASVRLLNFDIFGLKLHPETRILTTNLIIPRLESDHEDVSLHVIDLGKFVAHLSLRSSQFIN